LLVKGYHIQVVCQNVPSQVEIHNKSDAIIIDFSKAFNLVPHNWLLTTLAALGMDLRVREFLIDCTQRVTVGGQLSHEVKAI
jgi:hypothetical protein